MRGQGLQGLRRGAAAGALVLAAALRFAPAVGAGGGAAEEPAAEAAAAEAAPRPIPDAEIGLAGASVFAVPSPPPVVDEASDPGAAPLLPRAYPGAPPRIPHAVADMLPITRGDNLCLDCHLVGEKAEGEPTPLPASHTTDLRNAPGEPGEAAVGARYVCTACHLALTDAPPLVGNRFAAPKD